MPGKLQGGGDGCGHLWNWSQKTWKLFGFWFHHQHPMWVSFESVFRCLLRHVPDASRTLEHALASERPEVQTQLCYFLSFWLWVSHCLPLFLSLSMCKMRALNLCHRVFLERFNEVLPKNCRMHLNLTLRKYPEAWALELYNLDFNPMSDIRCNIMQET